MKTQIDHLVVVAQSLELAVQWCEATIGITPSSMDSAIGIIQSPSLLGYSDSHIKMSEK